MISMGTRVLASVALVLSLAICGHAFASSITYDFTGSSSGLGTGNLGVSSANVTAGGLPVTVRAFDEFGAAGELARNNLTGLGVVGAPGDSQAPNQVGADSNGAEALEFDFSPATVTILESVVFELGMEAGSLEVLADNVLLETISWTAATGTGTQGNSDVAHTFISPLSARTAQSFTFRAVTDGFRLKALVVTNLPEPTAFLLGLTALSGIALIRKRT